MRPFFSVAVAQLRSHRRRAVHASGSLVATFQPSPTSHTIISGSTSASVKNNLVERGVAVHLLQGMHLHAGCFMSRMK